MKNLVRAAAIFSGVMGLSGVAAALAVGCSGDDTVIGYGNDASGDSPTNPDTSVPDTGIGDSGSDVFSFDAGPPNLANFYHQIDQTGCAWLANCCGGPTAFSTAACIDAFDNNAATFGFDYTRPIKDGVDGGGNVTFNSTQANECLSLIQGVSCTAPLTSAQSIAIRTACYGAIQGNIPLNGTGCSDTIECASPGHCAAGTCIAPLVPGSPCALGGSAADSMNLCGRAYTGQPGTCALGGNDTLSEAGTCQNAFADGTPCFNPFECSSDICDSLPDGGGGNNLYCLETATYTIPQLTCSAFPPDAGDGG